MRSLIRLTESDLHKMVRNTVNRILKEQDYTMTLQLIAQEISAMGTVMAHRGENELEVEMDNGDIHTIVFEASSNPYIKYGMKSSSYDVPDDPDEVLDNGFELEVITITLDNGEEVEDNGIVYNALTNVVQMDYDDEDMADLEDWDDENVYDE